ncbi:DUF6037 family protein [Pseudogracilibacillus auburnensis]|uniref:DUF6037 family protein n=1 Tax=Pseudogracilibacillus auburnensis TaxID=1494959 RepID=UPI001A979D9D|nr:DUF6037 family protein [Pseudogracilibacillus auburnensis]MBO1001277.1 hypothetical protein [Pseudogracilibacillus auburnensis]
MVLSNLKKLRSDMIDNEKAVTVFRFDYKKIEYFVAVCLLTEEDKNRKETEFALVRLCFMQIDDVNEYLNCYANSKSITAGMTELRNYLGVEYQKDGIAWIKGFLSYFGQHVPEKHPAIQDKKEEEAVLHTICRHENRDPNRIYRNYIFRNGKMNGKQKYRTEYNAQLAAIRFPSLYERFKNYKEISFAFTDDVTKEKSEEEILSNFEMRENK